VICALTRVCKQLDRDEVNDIRLTKGRWPVIMRLDVTGDVNVAAAVEPGPEVEAPDVKPDELCAAILMGMDRATRRRTIRTAVRRIAVAREQHEKAGALDAAAKHRDEDLLEICRAEGVTKTTRSSGRAGAVTGFMSIDVSGTIAGEGFSIQLRP